MDWPAIIIGALAATGIAAIFGWVKKLVGTAPKATTKTEVSTDAPVLDVAKDIVDEAAKKDQSEIDTAMSSDSPEESLSHLINQSLGPHIMLFGENNKRDGEE